MASAAEKQAAGGRDLVSIHAMSAGYNGRAAIAEVDFSLAGGQRLALLGPNGGGKTTLLRTLLGELRPRQGVVELRSRCASVPQTDRSRLDYPVSALDVALMGSLARLAWWQRPGTSERERAREALDRVGLAGRADETFGRLSAGQRQRVLIARGLVQDADLLLLDEPFSGLDKTSAAGLEGLIESLAAEDRGLIIATHDLEQARRWDLVLCLNHRQIAFGHPEDVLDRPVLEATYGGEIVEIPGAPGVGLLPPHHHQDHD
jgi:ABC-type Mn2+/Zn2+ transport system ATPase subunit